MPVISVIVPVHNVEKYLHNCLDSILAQTFSDFELILIDDGSKDNSGKICDEYAEKDSRIRVFHQVNQGQAAARNFGVTQAKADWIHFVDSDDIIHPQMLESLYCAVQKDNSNIAMCDCKCIETESEVEFGEVSFDSITVNIDDEYLNSLLKAEDLKYHSVCAKLIKKEIVIKYPFTAGRTREDSAVVCRWLYSARKVSYFKEQLYFYVYNSGSTVRRGFDIKQFDRLWSLEQQFKFCKEEGFNGLGITVIEQHIILSFAFIKKVMNEYPELKECVPDIRKKAKKAVYLRFKMPNMDLKERLYYIELLYPKTMSLFWIIINKLHINIY